MTNFTVFMTLIFSGISHFLTTEPMIFFVGLIILILLMKALSVFISGSVRF